MGQVSIVDIAAAAGVAPSTVSRALRDHPDISQARRAAIAALAEQMGYRPSQIARGLVTGRTHALGLVVSDIADPFVGEVLKGAEAEGRAAGYTLLFASSDRRADQEELAIRLLVDRQVDGVIVVSGRAERSYTSLGGTSVRRPLVLVNNEQTAPGVHSVRTDNRTGTQSAVEHLAALGHRRIAFVAGPERGRSSTERLAGYRQAVREHGLVLDDGLLAPGVGMPGDGSRSLAFFMAQPEPPTAVLCYNDLTAIGLLGAAAQAGLRIPDDLSVVGFDNLPLSAHAVPPLTTVDQPKQDLGRAAVQMALCALAGGAVENRLLAGELIVRQSTAEPA